MSASPVSSSVQMLSTPSASCLAPCPFGISAVSVYGLRTYPIGSSVNIAECAGAGSVTRDHDPIKLLAVR